MVFEKVVPKPLARALTWDRGFTSAVSTSLSELVDWTLSLSMGACGLDGTVLRRFEARKSGGSVSALDIMGEQ